MEILVHTKHSRWFDIESTYRPYIWTGALLYFLNTKTQHSTTTDPIYPHHPHANSLQDKTRQDKEPMHSRHSVQGTQWLVTWHLRHLRLPCPTQLCCNVILVVVYACLDTCCSQFLTIIAGVDLHFRHESERSWQDKGLGAKEMGVKVIKY